MKKLCWSVLLALFTLTAFADMVFQINVDEPIVKNYRFENRLPKTSTPGDPMLPYMDIRILLPQGKSLRELTIDIDRKLTTEVEFIDYADEPYPISHLNPSSEQNQTNERSNTLPNRAVYERDSLYPYKDYEILGIQRKKGYDILVVNIYPYRYNPVRESVSWAESFQLNVRTEYDANIEMEQNLFLIENAATHKDISRLVINPEDVNTYQKQHIRRNPILPELGNPYQMIIISGQEQRAVFDEFIHWQSNRGIDAGFFTTNDIYAHYTGIDKQEKIRNFIIDAYQTYSASDTPLEYVILGGDDNIIPIRGMYGRVGNYVDYYMPADIYYSNLDGDWDANGNGIYGEVDDEVDWFSEVVLGRIPAYSDKQFLNFFNKTYYYVEKNSYSNDIVYMLGENLDHFPTWGGDYKDEIIPYIPEEYHISTLYERDGTFSSDAVFDMFDAGVGIINHIGHSDYNIVFGMNNRRISLLNNTEYGFAYTQGCYPAAFDNVTSMESGAVGQNFTISSGGLFAFIGNTRYGWYRRGTTDGPSQAFDKAFFSGLYDLNIRELGHTLVYSREILVNQAMAYSVMRWIYYQMVLFGDPSVAVKDPLGIYPYIEPVNVVFDDIEGDNDGVVNPGETIHIYVEIANLDNWADAYETIGTLSAHNDYINIVNDQAVFGFVPTNDSTNNEVTPYIIEIDPNTPYSNYELNLKLEATSVEGGYFARNYLIDMPVTLIQKHWPWRSEYSISAAPAVITVDDSVFVVAVDGRGSISFLDYDTSPSKKTITNHENVWRSTAYGDLSGVQDIVIPSRNNLIQAFSIEGDTLFTFHTAEQIIITPVVADINNNGSNQVVFIDVGKNLYLLDYDGNIADGFPVQLSQTSVGDLAVADLSGDGYQEIIVGCLNGMLYAVQYDGSILNGFPVNIKSQIITAPTVLNNYDIVVGTSANELVLISRDGDILHTSPTPGRISMEIIAADFIGNNTLQLAYVTSNGYVNITNRQGMPLPNFPFNANESFLYPPLAADMNNDGYVNLIAYTTNGMVYGFNSDATVIDYLPFPVRNRITAPATLFDIDNDGDMDIIFATASGLTVVDYKYNYGSKQPWTTYRANNSRTGFYGEDPTLSVDDELVNIPLTALKQNYPNPFNPNTTIEFSLKIDSHTVLEIFNLKGQSVATLINDKLQYGHHSIVWNGMNNNNLHVGSGVYFYRLQTDKDTITKKMILIK